MQAIQRGGQGLLNKEDLEEGIVGSGEKMQQVLKTVGQVAASEATVMVTGESGTERTGCPMHTSSQSP